MAESEEREAGVGDPDRPSASSAAAARSSRGPRVPPMRVPPEEFDAIRRYRRAAPWIIGAFGLMGAVILAAVPVSALSEMAPTNRRTIVLASILAFAGVAGAIISSALALAPRSVRSDRVPVKRSRVLKYFSARRAVGHTFARQRDAGSYDLVTLEDQQLLVRYEKERNAVRLGFVGVLVGAIAMGAAMGIILWEFENPIAPFEVAQIQAETRRIEVETEAVQAEIAQIRSNVRFDDAELAVQARQLELDLELLEVTIANTKADTVRLEQFADQATTVEIIQGQIADIEFSLEELVEQVLELRIETANRRSIAG